MGGYRLSHMPEFTRTEGGIAEPNSEAAKMIVARVALRQQRESKGIKEKRMDGSVQVKTFPRTCADCGIEFKALSPNRSHCDDCYPDAVRIADGRQKNKVIVTACENCGEKVTISGRQSRRPLCDKCIDIAIKSGGGS